MRYLLKYMKPYRKEAVLAPLFKLLEATLELFVPIVMTMIIDNGIANRDNSYILWMGAVLVAIAAVGMTVSITAQYFAAKAAVCFSTDVKHALFKHITHLSAESAGNLGATTLITRMTSDMNQVSTGVNLFLRLFLRSPFIVLGAMVMAFAIDVRAAAVFACVIPVIGIVLWSCLHYTIPKIRCTQKQTDDILRRTGETLSGARVVRAFVRQESEKRQFDDVNEGLYRKQMHVGRLSALMNPVTLLVVNVGIIVLVYEGGVRVEAGTLTQGQVVALVNYMSQILIELVKLANLILNINRALACAGRVREVFLLPEEGTDTDRCFEEGRVQGVAVRTENLSFRYPGAQGDALKGLTFSALPGETWGIIGGTGAGKTTLLSLLLGFYHETGGVLYINECVEKSDNPATTKMTDINQQIRSVWRADIGYAPQRSVLFSGTIRENLLMGDREASDSALWEALDVAQAADFIRKKDGLDTVVEQGGRNFSGGQRQRLCIARALVRRPKLLLLDDAFSALDTATEKRLRSALRKYLSETGTTTLIVSQRIASVRDADGIIVLDEGETVGVGTHDELLRSCEVYREIAQIGGGA
ncbi:MAG: ABC transporter ATP-binding protein [Eubacterium sp.]|nr:ABC transporter ATP-binding protein [Eubacterium sp.]